mmetsp:Transcript_36253/g.40353  ORF Transcript_36253/g.40353 Transcript_36253/m.40353 type:complete len:237 (-) Transcript_36253:9-719(-)
MIEEPFPYNPIRFRTSINLVSECVLNGSRFVLTVPENMTGSCGITAMLARSFFKPTDLISISSITICPLSSSAIRVNAFTTVLFPAPVLPTIPTLAPLGIFIFNPFKANGVSGRYRKFTFLNSTDPLDGHSFSTNLSLGMTCGASFWSCVYCRIRSTETIPASNSLLNLTAYKSALESCSKYTNAIPLKLANDDKSPPSSIMDSFFTINRAQPPKINMDPTNSSLNPSQDFPVLNR